MSGKRASGFIRPQKSSKGEAFCWLCCSVNPVAHGNTALGPHALMLAWFWKSFIKIQLLANTKLYAFEPDSVDLINGGVCVFVFPSGALM